MVVVQDHFHDPGIVIVLKMNIGSDLEHQVRRKKEVVVVLLLMEEVGVVLLTCK